MVIDLIRLVRWKNLLITAGLILILKYIVFETAINTLFSLSESQFSFGMTVLLILSLVFLAAGGYIINDIYDEKTDLINKEDKVIINKSISEKTATTFYYIFNILGVGIGLYIGKEMGNYQIGFLHAIVAAIFWLYSAHLKGTLLIGNIVIAFASCTVPLIYFGFEGYTYLQKYGAILAQEYNSNNGIVGPVAVLFFFCLILSIFAFLLSLAREIVKDIEDQQGDAATGARTLPIAMGETVAKTAVQALGLGVIALMAYLLHFKIKMAPFNSLTFIIYCYVGIVAPTVYLIWEVRKAETQQELHKVSTIIKMIMVAGILTAFIYSFNA